MWIPSWIICIVSVDCFPITAHLRMVCFHTSCRWQDGVYNDGKLHDLESVWHFIVSKHAWLLYEREPVFCIFSRRTLQHGLAAIVVCGSPMSASHRFSPWPCNQKHAAGHTVTWAALWWTLPPPSLTATINKPLHFWVKRPSALISSSPQIFSSPKPRGQITCSKASVLCRLTSVSVFSPEFILGSLPCTHESTSFEVTWPAVAL